MIDEEFLNKENFNWDITVFNGAYCKFISNIYLVIFKEENGFRFFGSRIYMKTIQDFKTELAKELE